MPHMPVLSIIIWKVKHPLGFAISYFQSITVYTAVWIQNYTYLKSTSVIKEATMTISITKKEAITCNRQIDTFHYQQGWLEHTGENALYMYWQAEAT